jgi:pilus assembly protein CpaD
MLNSYPYSSHRSLRRVRQLALCVVAGVTLSACLNGAGLEDAANGNTATMPHEKFPIQVVAKDQEMTVMAPINTATLSPSDMARVASFASSYRHVGHGEMWVAAPSGSQNQAASSNVAAEISRVLVAQGLSPAQITLRTYQSSAANAPITIRFKRYDTVTSACRNWDSNVAFSPMNGSTPNFGCATQSNIATMVEDPHDLIAPRTMSAADADRRTTVMDSYRNGEATGTARSSDESGTVSEINE